MQFSSVYMSHSLFFFFCLYVPYNAVFLCLCDPFNVFFLLFMCRYHLMQFSPIYMYHSLFFFFSFYVPSSNAVFLCLHIPSHVPVLFGLHVPYNECSLPCISRSRFIRHPLSLNTNHVEKLELILDPCVYILPHELDTEKSF